ncbi:MAG: hypothetical protein AAF843_15585 [Bacteroidota bacterium]
MCKFFTLFLSLLVSSVVVAQHTYYDEITYRDQLDSLRELNDFSVQAKGDPLELAVNIALSHYPELQGHKFKIKYKKNVKHPVTASWAFGNIFKRRKNHTYVLLLSENVFLKRLPLNGQIGVFGHEMAHFKYYSEKPSIHMLWWGIKYVTSKKFHREFERDADKTTIEHGLGRQLLGVVFYMKRSEVKEYMDELGTY